jgi:hypothetical protein
VMLAVADAGHRTWSLSKFQTVIGFSKVTPGVRCEGQTKLSNKPIRE